MIEDIEEMEEEEDEEELRSSNAKQTRRPRYKYKRVSWPEELERLLLPSGNQFQSRYHMSETSFNKLVGILGTKVQIDEKQSMRSTSGSLPFSPHHVVGAGLRFLGGELPKSIGDCYGCHPKTAHSMIARFLTAVDTTEDLDIKIPTSPAELKTPAELKKFLQKIQKITDL